MEIKENVPPPVQKTVDLLGLTEEEVGLIYRFANYYAGLATFRDPAAERLADKLKSYSNAPQYPYSNAFKR